MELSTLKSLITESFRHQKGVIAVLLYGSYARGTAKADSDVDIAVLYEHESVPAETELWTLQGYLEEKLEREVDLVCLNDISLILASQIYKYHQRVVVNDQKKLDEYFMRLMVNYAELKEFRLPIEEHILKRRFYDKS
jgi:predicted nucleotidyltransferase